MANIYVSTLSTPRIPRNKRIYSKGTTVNRVSVGTTPVPGVQRHIEARTLKYSSGSWNFDNVNSVGKTVEVLFVSPFLEVPTGTVDVYRMQNEATGWMKADVYYHFDVEEWETINGFTLVIEEWEDLEGVIIKYNYTTQS